MFVAIPSHCTRRGVGLPTCRDMRTFYNFRLEAFIPLNIFGFSIKWRLIYKPFTLFLLSINDERIETERLGKGIHEQVQYLKLFIDWWDWYPFVIFPSMFNLLSAFNHLTQKYLCTDEYDVWGGVRKSFRIFHFIFIRRSFKVLLGRPEILKVSNCSISWISDSIK